MLPKIVQADKIDIHTFRHCFVIGLVLQTKNNSLIHKYNNVDLNLVPTN